MAQESEDVVSFALRAVQDFSKNNIVIKRITDQLNLSPGPGTVGLLALTVLAVVLGMLILQWRFRQESVQIGQKRKLPLPPGSFGLPFVGETLSYLAALRANKPERFFLSRAAKHGKVFKSSLMGWPIVSVDAPSGNKFIFSNEGKLVDSFYPKSIAEIIGKKSFNLKPFEQHRRERRIIMTCLSGETLHNFAPRMEANVLAHLAEFWEGKSQVSAAPSIKHLAFQVACDLFLNLRKSPELTKLEEDYRVLLNGLMSFPINLPGFTYHKALAARASVLSFLGTCIARRREELKEGSASPDQDLLSVLLTVPDENGEYMSDEVIKDNLLFVVAGGYETASNTMAIALKHLAEHPSILATVLKEQSAIAAQKEGGGLTWKDLKLMKYTWHVLQEITRLHPQVNAGFREVLIDFEYEGYTIPKGWKFIRSDCNPVHTITLLAFLMDSNSVRTIHSPLCNMMWSPGRSHKLPEFFPDPEKFDPSRFEGSGPQPYTYLSFGSGPHSCPGIEYARMEMLLYMHHVVTRYQWTLVDPCEQITINPSPYPKKGLPLNISPRTGSNQVLK